MKEVTIKSFDLNMKSGRQIPTQISFDCSAQFGDWLGLSAHIAFNGGSIAVVGVLVAQSIDVASLLGWIAPNVPWRDLLPITFSPTPNTSGMRLYYATDKSVDPSYLPGFNLDHTRIAIFKPEWAADVSLRVNQGNIAITGALESPIDLLGVIQITGKNNHRQARPLRRRRKSRAATRSPSRPIHGLRQHEQRIRRNRSLDPAGRRRPADAREDHLPGGQIEGVDVPPVTFTYDEQNGFQLEAFDPFPGKHPLFANTFRTWTERDAETHRLAVQ